MRVYNDKPKATLPGTREMKQWVVYQDLIIHNNSFDMFGIYRGFIVHVTEFSYFHP